MHGLSYGSLIKEDVVLTAASKVTKFSSGDLEVIANWQYAVKIRCDSRSILSLFSPPNLDKNHQVTPSDWVLLKLSKPFELYDKVGIITLADRNHQWDSEDCSIYHWMSVRSEYKVGEEHILEEGYLHQEYRVSITPGSFGLYEEEVVKLHNDVDCIVDKCSLSYGGLRDVRNISFVGSPIICKLLDQDQYVQVGFTNFVGRLILDKTVDDLAFKDISEYNPDTFVDLTKDFDEVIRPKVFTD